MRRVATARDSERGRFSDRPRHTRRIVLRSFTNHVEQTLGRSSASALAIAVLTGLLTAAAWQNGGFFPAAYLRIGSMAFAATALLLLVRPPTYRVSREALIAIGGLGAFAGFAALATTWSPSPPTGSEDALRDLGYVGILALSVLASGSGRLARVCVWGTLTAGLVIVVAGLVSRLYPAGSPVPLALDQSQYRLNYPLGYWNTYGALAGMVGVLAVGLAADRRVAVALRALASAAAVVATVAMYLSLSRGSWLAVGAGLVVLVVVAPNRGAILVALGLVSTAAVLALLRLRSFPALVDDPLTGAGQAAAGRAYAPTLALLAVGCGAAQALLAAPERRLRRILKRWLATHRVGVARVRIAGLLVVALLAVLGMAAEHGSIEHFVNRQWHQFANPTRPLEHGSSRLTSTNTSRGEPYRVALDEFTSAPLGGVGSGGFQAGWYRYRHDVESIENAHSLYLETLGELGIVGLLLLLIFLAAFARGWLRSRRRPAALSRTQASAVLAASLVWAVHAGLDWDWQMPAFTGLALLLMGTVFPVGRTPAAGRPSAPRRALVMRGLAGACVVAAVYLWLSGIQAQRLTNSNRLGRAGDFGAALALARSVTMSPASAGAKLTEAYALQDLGNLAASDRAFRDASGADPSNWVIRRDWAVELAQAGDLDRARRQLREAVALNPKMLVPASLAGLRHR